jgi:hypothetical protein
VKFPSTIGACIDALYKLRQERFAIEKKAEAIQKKESELESHILETFNKSDLDGARGKFATAGVSQNTVPTVKDWDKLYRYIKKTDAFELLQRRVSATAYRERLDQKEVVPGVEAFIVTKLSLKKR